MSSLRFRLPAFFLAGVALAGIVSTAIAVQLFQDHLRSQSLSELRREAKGLTQLYQAAAIRSIDEGRSAPDFAGPELEKATGTHLYYVGAPIFFRHGSGLRELDRDQVGNEWQTLIDGQKVITFEFTPPGESKPFQAVGQPLQLEGQNFGALIVAKKKTDLTNGWFSLFELLLVALGVGLLVAAALAWYLSRRIAKPVLALSAAADRIAQGKYDIAVPDVPGSGEVSHLAERFRQMASRLAEAEEQERNFLMSVSHELRTPLTAIRGHVEALREGLIDDPEAEAESLSVVAMEAERLERLVGDVLDLAKLDAHRFTVLHEEVDMGSLVDQVYAAYGEEARRRGIDYVFDGNGGGPVIVSDGDRVFQIVSNLLNNAFRWTPDGGRIELALAAANGTISVSVADTGPGIKPADRDRIFRPFWSRDGGGTGLGLAIARELAVALGGRIELESELGAGTRFDLKLPAAPPGLDFAMPVAVATPRSVARAAFAGMRPKQWSKNLLLFAGLLFANELGDATKWLQASVAFAAYCAASSAAYLANDVRDAEHDRAHPVKRLRPVASGELPVNAALVLAGVLSVAAFAATAFLGAWSVVFMAAFLILQAAYSGGLKHVVLIDVFAIAALFVIRAAAGAQAVDVRISPWLLVCTGLLALFLALAKRRAELVLVGAEATPGRPVLEGYSLVLVDQLVTVVAASTVIAYSLYTFTAHDTKAMMATIPFVVYGVFRYLLLLHRHDLGEEPEDILLTDVPLILTLVGWAATSAVILALG